MFVQVYFYLFISFIPLEQGSSDCMSVILEKADTEVKNPSGRTPLFLAIQNKQEECMKILVNSGASKRFF
jgi:ankyrin repeat protein